MNMKIIEIVIEHDSYEKGGDKKLKLSYYGGLWAENSSHQL